jgi:hypothetical protein
VICVRFLLGAWLVFFVLFLRSARADEAERTIEVTIAGHPETTAALRTGIIEFSSRRSVQVTWAHAPAIHPRDVLASTPSGSTAFARIWLDVTSPEQAVLYIADTTSDRFLLRVVPLDAGYDEVARESLGNIVESAIDALLAGADIGVSREAAEEQVARQIGPVKEPPPRKLVAPPRQAPPPEPAPSAAPGVCCGWWVGYRGHTLRGQEALQHGPELGVALMARDEGISPAAFISLGYRLPSEWKGDALTLELHGAGARAWFGMRAVSGAFRGYLGAGLGFEATRVEARARTAEVSPRGPTWTAAPMALGVVGVGWGLTSALELTLTGAAEFDLLGHHFDVLSTTGTETVLEPWAVRPAGTLALLLALD